MAQVAFGLKAHSGWAALVALRENGRTLEIVERRRLELIAAGDAAWAKQPYHAAAGLDPEDAGNIVRRGVEAAHAQAARSLGAALEDRRASGDGVVGCGVLLGAGMPGWSVAEILAVHLRMHQAEGELFQGALVQAATGLGLAVMGIREKELEVVADKALRLPAAERSGRLSEAGRRAGPPWGRDQKEAALVAWIALRGAER